jgi:hypothetical protein
MTSTNVPRHPAEMAEFVQILSINFSVIVPLGLTAPLVKPTQMNALPILVKTVPPALMLSMVLLVFALEAFRAFFVKPTSTNALLRLV